MCGNVICGRFDPSKKFFTEKGSFWANDTTRLIATTTDADRQTRTRNRCNGEGYESVALLALRVGDNRLGLLQLNDKRKNMFTLEKIQMWERIADSLAVALSRTIAEESHKIGAGVLYQS
jgi:GAF domain-containing protein